jgi:hypothetical protein
MPLNDMQIRRAKPEAKAYTLGDGQGLSLLIEPNGSKAGGSAIAMPVSPK